MIKTFKYRLVPTRKQGAALQRTLDLCRKLYRIRNDVLVLTATSYQWLRTLGMSDSCSHSPLQPVACQHLPVCKRVIE